MNEEELLRDLYVNQELPIQDIIRQMNLGSRTSLNRRLKKYGITRDKAISQKQRVLLQKQSFIKKYGVEHYSKTSEFKERVKQTSLEKYGVDNAAKSQEIKNKVANNNLEKYGETNPLKVEEIRERIRIENIDKKGYAYPLQQMANPEAIRIVTILENFKEYLKDHNYTVDEIAENLSCHRTFVLRYLKKFDLLKDIDYRPNHSMPEKELKEILGRDFKPDRSILKPKEIDLYNDKLKLGIEFNGNWWHSVNNKGYKYHRNKSIKAKEKGIRLIHIFEYEWDDLITKEKIISLLRNLVNDQRKIIYARQCKMKQLDFQQVSEFLNKYHLQGADSAPIRYGLFYDEELVGCMTFCKPRFDKHSQWELSRLCWHKDYKVVGGTHKLFSEFVKNYNPTSIVSYCDESKFTGEVYKRLGFVREKLANCNYVWCNKYGEILKRYQCQKHKLIEQYPEYENLSESQIMTILGYWKIEDVGNAVYRWYN